MNTNTETLLEVQNICVNYGGVKALDGVSLEIDEGEIVALMGPNGAGKSTVLKSIFGLAPISSGKVLWHAPTPERGKFWKSSREAAIPRLVWGHEKPPKPHIMVELGLAFVPQGRRVFTHLSVEENLEVGGFVIKDKSLVKNRIAEVMDLFPVLKSKRKDKSGALSGGQQQMLAVARGLMVDPKVLLLDEPSLGLAPKIVKEVFEKILEINERRKTVIMVVEHNIKSLLSIAHRAYVLDKGKVVITETNPKSLIVGDRLEKVFLGKI